MVQLLISITVLLILAFVLLAIFRDTSPSNNSAKSNQSSELKSVQPKSLSINLETPKPEPAINFAYERKPSLLTPTERSFFEDLRYAVADHWYIFSKVRLEDIISVQEGLEKKEAYGLRSRIKSRHIDFVLCDKESLAIEVCIELDDWTHKRKSRRERDEFVDQALKAASVKIEHVQVQRSYDKDYLRSIVLPNRDWSEQETA